MHKDRNCPTENLGKSEQCQGCPNQSICSTEKIDESIPIIAENVSHFKLIIVVMSGKGGVGKSTVTRNIAEYLSQKNKKVLLLDLDLSGPSIPKMTSSEGQSLLESNNIIYPVKLSDNLGCISTGYISNEELYTSSFRTNTIRKMLMNSSFREYEILVIDTPPNITDEHLGIVNYLQVSFAIIVTTPQMISFQDVKRQFTFCNKNNLNILGVIENMKGFQCGKCNCIQNIFYDSDIQEQCKKYNVPYLGNIPLKMEYAKKGDEGSAIDDNIFEEVIDKILKFY